MSVDLPMPGSPPTSTVAPRMRPPPSTRFSSAMPLSIRRPAVFSIAARGTAVAGAPAGRGGLAGASSVKLFHAPHEGHRPSHFGSRWPHEEHANEVFGAFSLPI